MSNTTTERVDTETSGETTEPAMAPVNSQDLEEGLALAKLALEVALDKKALEPVLLDVHELCSYTDYLLLLSGRSDRQLDAIAEGIKRALREQGHRTLGSEGVGAGQWALLDYGNVVVHVFHHPIREHYNLESLWNEARRVPIEVPPEARMSAEDAY